MNSSLKSRIGLAAYEGFPPDVAVHVHKALMRFPETLDTLSRNETLSEDLWLTLWGTKRPSASQAKILVARCLSPRLRKHVIATEDRSTVLTEFVSRNRLTKDEQTSLVATEGAREALLGAGWLDKDLRTRLVEEVGGEFLLQQMAVFPLDKYSDDFVSEHIIANMSVYATKRSKGISRDLRLIFGRRPGTIAKVMPHAKRNVLTSMAGSANLTEVMCEQLAKYENGVTSVSAAEIRENVYFYLALIANPRTPLYVVQALGTVAMAGGELLRATHKRGTLEHISGKYEEVSDAATLKRLIGRACENKGRDYYSPPRPVELIALSVNPNLSASQRAKVDESLQVLDADILSGDPVSVLSFGRPDRPHPVSDVFRVAEYDLAAAVIGPSSSLWEIMTSLINDHQGTFEDLLNTTLAI